MTFIATAVAFAVILLPFYLPAWFAAVPRIWKTYPEMWQSVSGRVLAIAILLLLAVALYIVRRTARFLYGIGEIGVGAAVCWFTLRSGEPGDATTALKLAAAVYIMVRGFDNGVEGYGKTTFWKYIEREDKRFRKRYAQSHVF